MRLSDSILLVSVILFCFAENVYSQEQSSVEVVQVSGTRLNEGVLGAYSVIIREQIEQINPASTTDLLKRLPHVDVSENGSAGGLPFVSIRGGEFNFTLVTIDGIPVNDSTNSRGGGFDFNQINPSAIERIEVFRGGVNTIYGGDAISGAINIVTRDTTSPVLGLELGNNKDLNASLTASYQAYENLTVLASLSSQNKAVSSFEKLASDQILLKMRYQGTNHNVAGLLTHNQSDVSGFTEDSGGEVFAMPKIAEQRDSKQTLMGLTSTVNASDSLSLSAQLSWLRREEGIINPGISEGVFSGIPPSNIRSTYEKLEFDLYSNFQITDNTDLIFGGSHRTQDGKNRGELDFGGGPLQVDYDFSQDINSTYAELQHSAKNLTFELSARLDLPQSFDNETSVRLGVTYNVNKQYQIFATYNEGYKLPSFFALAHPLVGNSALRPERSKNFDLGFSSQFNENTQYSVVFYMNRFTDLVDFDAALFTNVNRNKVNTSGLEFDFITKINSHLNFVLNTRYLEIDADDGVVLRKRPNISGNASLDIAYKKTNNSIYIDFRDEFLDSSIATGFVRLPGHVSVGFSSVVNLSSNTDITINIENVLGKQIEDSVGFLQNDAQIRLGLTYRF
ncbi:TonB-dependent receptor plug domain-containing protein [Glaciecola sp. SC05]|uniref:TonB-dependent receptor plug domain-containing protein n=1 Tax=Glaciecola sp. SC05 TaxID=1987355 RepID=UPI003528D419